MTSKRSRTRSRTTSPKASAYARAGVDIDRKMAAVGSAGALFQRTFDANVLSSIGGFGSLYRFRPRGMKDPLLCASTDGVGTKLKLAFATGRHDTVGQDIVNHCINDILVQGAMPLFLLDYVASGRLREGVLHELFEGLAKACTENGCSLVGGETAEMPGMYPDGEYDLAATVIGVVDRPRLLPHRDVGPGDILIGLPSTGLHTNGYTLARKVLVKTKRDLRRRLPEVGATVADALLAVHRSYLPALRGPISKGRVKALVHVTGGGFWDNIPRVLPKGCVAEVDAAAWEVPPLFRVICERGKVDAEEAFRVFNMGIGMIVVAAPDEVDGLRRSFRRRGWDAPVIGSIRKGRGKVRIRNLGA